MTKNLLIIWHSLTGGSLQLAKAALRGAGREKSVFALLVDAKNATPQLVLNSHGFIFAAPEMNGTMSGGMKDFFDRTYYQVLDENMRGEISVEGLP